MVCELSMRETRIERRWSCTQPNQLLPSSLERRTHLLARLSFPATSTSLLTPHSIHRCNDADEESRRAVSFLLGRPLTHCSRRALPLDDPVHLLPALRRRMSLVQSNLEGRRLARFWRLWGGLGLLLLVDGRREGGPPGSGSRRGGGRRLLRLDGGLAGRRGS